MEFVVALYALSRRSVGACDSERNSVEFPGGRFRMDWRGGSQIHASVSMRVTTT